MVIMDESTRVENLDHSRNPGRRHEHEVRQAVPMHAKKYLKPRTIRGDDEYMGNSQHTVVLPIT